MTRLHLLTTALLMVLASSGALSSPGAHGPNGEHLDAPAPTGSAGLARLADGSVNVPMLAQRRMNLRTQVSVESEVARTVELPGRVVMDPNAGGRVQTAVGGKVEPGPNGLPVAGQTVRKGEVLAFVAHHVDPVTIGGQQSLLAELRTARTITEQRVARLTGLEGTVPRKDIDAAKAELEGLLAREKAIAASVGARERLIAPISGVIARADVVSGQVVEGKDVLYEIVDPARALVEATTTDVALGNQIATAALAGVDGVKLQFLGAARALREGTLPLTFRATTSGQLPLAIGQPVTVIARLAATVKGHVLPAQAITRNPANEPVVWIKSGAERYIPQPVQFRPLDSKTVVVTQGLGADNRVVVQGAPLIAQIR